MDVGWRIAISWQLQRPARRPRPHYQVCALWEAVEREDDDSDRGDDDLDRVRMVTPRDDLGRQCRGWRRSCCRVTQGLKPEA